MTSPAEAISNALLPAQHPILQTRTIENPITDLSALPELVDKSRPALLKMLASVQPFMCVDESRSGLNRVHVEVHDDKHLIFMASDGHTAAALAVEFFEAHGLPAGCVGLTSASVEVFISSKGFAPLVACPEGETFPWLRNVVSIHPEPYAGVFGVNPIYFARITTAMKKLGYGNKTAVRIECGPDRVAPILATAPEETVGTKSGPTVVVKLMVVTMPMRLG